MTTTPLTPDAAQSVAPSPTREQRIHYPGSYTARRAERVVTKAIRSEFSDLPF